jgi:hypothetical protein
VRRRHDDALEYLVTLAARRDLTSISTQATNFVLDALSRDPLAVLSLPEAAFALAEISQAAQVGIRLLPFGKAAHPRDEGSDSWEATVHHGLIAAAQFVDATGGMPDDPRPGAGKQRSHAACRREDATPDPTCHAASVSACDSSHEVRHLAPRRPALGGYAGRRRKCSAVCPALKVLLETSSSCRDSFSPSNSRGP